MSSSYSMPVAAPFLRLVEKAAPAKTLKMGVDTVREMWPETSFMYGEGVIFKENPKAKVYLNGRIIGLRQGRTGETTYVVQVGVGRLFVKTRRELAT